MTESWQKAVDQENLLMRLSSDITPKTYNVQLLPILENDNFTNYGQVDITIDCVRNTQQILLNAGNYRIHSYEVLHYFRVHEKIIKMFIVRLLKLEQDYNWKLKDQFITVSGPAKSFSKLKC